MSVDLSERTDQPRELNVPDSRGLRVVVSVRPVQAEGGEAGIPPGTRYVSLFLVNRRPPSPDEARDEAFAFQAELEARNDEPLVPRPNLRSLESEDWDERVADLQYRDACEFAVGHSVATEAIVEDGHCRTVRTCWIPQAEVERVAPAPIRGVELSMEALSQLADGDEAKANRRFGVIEGKDPQGVVPEWRPFQLAFLLMNLAGIVDPNDDDREVVDLLFFPTGGGKTEAYLGLAAFTLVLRRLRNPGIGSAGLTVLMRYTLRLLTLDQLARAATLICALELERQNDVDKLGEWPFEIGLWVGKAATPNRMGRKGDNDRQSARAKTIAFKNDDRKPSPIPLEECPWCGTKFKSSSFQLLPHPDYPTDLRVMCVNRRCDFSRGMPLPILAVDDPIYRRLPCLMIATVDKFAAMPWTGEVGTFFGRVQRYDSEGFYGPCEPTRGHPLPDDRLPPPDLIVQDELHMISVGLDIVRLGSMRDVEPSVNLWLKTIDNLEVEEDEA